MAQDKSSTQAQDKGAPVEAQAQGALTAADVAALAGVPVKDFRRWMRAQARAVGAGDALPGKGRRYAYTEEQAQALASAYGRTKAAGTYAPAEALMIALDVRA